jgi:hypothetical protein
MVVVGAYHSVMIALCVVFLAAADSCAQSASRRVVDAALTMQLVVADERMLYGVEADGRIIHLHPDGDVLGVYTPSVRIVDAKRAVLHEGRIWLLTKAGRVVVIDPQQWSVDSVAPHREFANLCSGGQERPVGITVEGDALQLHHSGATDLVWNRSDGICTSIAFSNAYAYLLTHAGSVHRTDGATLTWKKIAEEVDGYSYALALTDSTIAVAGLFLGGHALRVIPLNDVDREYLISTPQLVDGLLPFQHERVVSLTVSARVVAIDLQQRAVRELVDSVGLFLPLMTNTAMCRFNDAIIVCGPMATLRRSIDGRTLRTLSSLASPLYSGLDLILLPGRERDTVVMLCSVSRVFYSTTNGSTWSTDTRYYDTVSLGTAMRLDTLHGGLYLLYTANDNTYRAAQVTPGGRPIGGFDVTSPIRLFQRSDGKTVIVTEQGVGLRNDTGRVEFVQLFNTQTITDAVRIDERTVVAVGYAPRPDSLSCRTPMRIAFLARIDLDALTCIDTMTIPEVDNLFQIVLDQDGSIITVGMGRDEQCRPSPAVLRLFGDRYTVELMPQSGTFQSIAMTDVGLVAGGYWNSLYVKPKHESTWQHLDGWGTEAYCDIESVIALPDGAALAVGNDNGRVVILRIDTVEAVTSVVDVTVIDPGPAPIVIDAVVPNPASQEVAVTIFRDRSWPIASCALELIDMSGIVVRDFSAELHSASDDTPMSVRCPLDGLPNGQYLLSATVAGKRSTKVVVKRPQD